MNPKISDFGMAKIFGGNQNQANTTRVVGTYGYMSPEYAMEGLFSIKSDVYSFGVLLLEIVSGKKNSYFRHTDKHPNLLVLAWNLWNEGKVMEFADPSISYSYTLSEVSSWHSSVTTGLASVFTLCCNGKNILTGTELSDYTCDSLLPTYLVQNLDGAYKSLAFGLCCCGRTETILN
ncbi:hypothetical protein C5167_039332 [Papaver somniferum]|uniref:Protein kinase domain-containing protein n=1 Tax=Papaver somniferum TaxID=3469 RepID=A0A4Y7IC07_PAPSO|nr:hypothetical protein C5167_039332 [Papaver somniferum]